MQEGALEVFLCDFSALAAISLLLLEPRGHAFISALDQSTSLLTMCSGGSAP